MARPSNLRSALRSAPPAWPAAGPLPRAVLPLAPRAGTPAAPRGPCRTASASAARCPAGTVARAPALPPTPPRIRAPLPACGRAPPHARPTRGARTERRARVRSGTARRNTRGAGRSTSSCCALARIGERMLRPSRRWRARRRTSRKICRRLLRAPHPASGATRCRAWCAGSPGCAGSSRSPPSSASPSVSRCWPRCSTSPGSAPPASGIRGSRTTARSPAR